ncbi:MAG: PQQ-binding-like beta-propeller repeat protein [Pirellulaceae bacterium]
MTRFEPRTFADHRWDVPRSDVNWRFTDALVPVAVGLIGALLIGIWLGSGPSHELAVRQPGQDQPAGLQDGILAQASVPVAGTPQAGPGVASQVPGSWPWFRGPALDGICRDTTPLARSWPEAGPPVLWTIPLGEGYAGATIHQGRVYVLDYDEQAKADTLRCLSLDDGREIWHNSYPVEVTRNHGMSRTVPAIVDDTVITIGPRCHVAAWDAATGASRWLIDLVLEFGTQVPRWYTGQCPLIDGGRLILAPGGPEALLAAIDIQTGKAVWQTPNPRRRAMTHASVVPMEYLGRRMYVYCASSAVVGVAAEDGMQLWESTDWFEQFATSPSPVILSEGKVFLCSGYGNKIGSLMMQLLPAPEGIQAQRLFELAPKQFNSEQQTPIYHDGHLFGVRKQGGGRLVCFDPDGNEIWNSGKDRFGHGPYLIVGDLILAMSNEGELVMAEASSTAYRPLARCQAFEDGRDAWGPMALAGGRLIVRDMTRMTCLNLAASKEEE